MHYGVEASSGERGGGQMAFHTYNLEEKGSGLTRDIHILASKPAAVSAAAAKGRSMRTT